MQRQIKFRAWDKKNKKMFAVHELSFVEENGKVGNVKLIRGYSSVGCTEFEGRDMFGGYNIKRFELMQYTGLLDKNGKEIFEGDIFRIPESVYPNRHYQIKWCNNNACFGSIGEISGESVGFNIDYGTCNKEIEIIGNIHSNPELMEGEDNG
ncbi:MAG: YopX family protein [Veillonellales bacterium]